MIVDAKTYPEAASIEPKLQSLSAHQQIRLAARITSLVLTQLQRGREVIPNAEYAVFDSILRSFFNLAEDVELWPSLDLPNELDPATTGPFPLEDAFEVDGLTVEFFPAVTAAACNLIVDGVSAVNEKSCEDLLAAAIDCVLACAHDVSRRTPTVTSPISRVAERIGDLTAVV